MQMNPVTEMTRRQIDRAVRAAEEARNRIAAASPPPGRQVPQPRPAEERRFEPQFESDLV